MKSKKCYKEDCQYSNYSDFDYRKSMRNIKVCNSCVYNKEYTYIKLSIQDQRKIKLIKLCRVEDNV